MGEGDSVEIEGLPPSSSGKDKYGSLKQLLINLRGRLTRENQKLEEASTALGPVEETAGGVEGEMEPKE